MFKAILIVSLFLGSTSFAKHDKIREANNPVGQTAQSNELKVGVKGMVCAFCAQGIEKKFKAEKEVEKVDVSLEKKLVKLTFKDGMRLSNERITEILKDAGYDADFGANK